MGEVIEKQHEGIPVQEEVNTQPPFYVATPAWSWRWISDPIRHPDGRMWYIMIRETSQITLRPGYSKGDYWRIYDLSGFEQSLNPEVVGFPEYEGALAPKARSDGRYIGTFLYSRMMSKQLTGAYWDTEGASWITKTYTLDYALRRFEVIGEESGFAILALDSNGEERWLRIKP